MNRRPYTPQPGTVPHLVLAHLKTLPPGSKINTGMLAAAVGHDSGSMKTFCGTAIKAGLVRFELTPGDRNAWWSLGDGKPLEGEAEEEAGDDELTKGAAPMPNPALSSIFALGQSAQALAAATPIKPAPRKNAVASHPLVSEPPAVAPAQPQPSTESGFGCALWNDGKLVLNLDGQVIELSPQRTRELVRYLERMVEVEA